MLLPIVPLTVSLRLITQARAVQGHQKNDFVLNAINPPQRREQQGRGKKGVVAHEAVYPAKQKWALDDDADHTLIANIDDGHLNHMILTILM